MKVTTFCSSTASDIPRVREKRSGLSLRHIIMFFKYKVQKILYVYIYRERERERQKYLYTYALVLEIERGRERGNLHKQAPQPQIKK